MADLNKKNDKVQITVGGKSPVNKAVADKTKDIPKKVKKVKYGPDGRPLPPFGKRVKNFFSGLKSELKKIVWMPWNQVCKSTLVVLVVVAAVAVVIGVLDFVFSKGILALDSFFA